jgi:hypothetical protein
MTEITLTFPDGSKRPYMRGISGRDLAAAISKSLAKKAVAMLVDGRLTDLADPIAADASVKILSRTDPEALELIRHDCAHVMAEAVQALWPGTQVTIGPVIENGFFYDFAKEEPFHPDDLARIEAKMHEIVARNAPFTKELWSREDAKAFFKRKGELFKIELVDAIPAGEDLKIYKQGEWLDLCRGPHMTSTGQIGKAFKLTHFAGSYWRGNAQGPKLQRIYGTAWASEPELADYLEQHIAEESGEDEWALQDLEVLGVDRSAVLARVPSANVARLVGAEYYWVLHVDPVAVLGYLAALERDPTPLEFIDELIRRTGYERAAFRTLIAHAERDPDHARELDELLDRIELTNEQWELVTLSAMNSVQQLARVFDDIVQAADLRKVPPAGIEPAHARV